MQVTCPHCGARYQFDKALIPPGGYDAQCANCSGIFPVAPSAQGEEMPIALPSMSMVDTWLTAPPIAPKKRAKETPPTAQNVAISAVEPVAPEPPAKPPVVAPTPSRAPVETHAPSPGGSLAYTIACPQCATAYELTIEDIPIGGLNATCPQCTTQYRLTSVGILSVPADLLAPASPILLEDRVTLDAPRAAMSSIADSVKPRPRPPAIPDFEAAVAAAMRQDASVAPSSDEPGAADEAFALPSMPEPSITPETFAAPAVEPEPAPQPELQPPSGLELPPLPGSPVREVTHARETPFASELAQGPTVPESVAPGASPTTDDVSAQASVPPLPSQAPAQPARLPSFAPPAWNGPVSEAVAAPAPAFDSTPPAMPSSTREPARPVAFAATSEPPAASDALPDLPPMVAAEPLPSFADRGPSGFNDQLTAEHSYMQEPRRGLDAPLDDERMAPPSGLGPAGLDGAGDDFLDDRFSSPLQNVRVPPAMNERSRHGAASWGPSSGALPPGVKMRAGDAKRKRRPPFDDDDAAHWRTGRNVKIDARDYDDTAEVIRDGVRSPARRFFVTLLVVAAVGAGLAYGIPWVRSGGLTELLGLPHGEDARVTALLQTARATMLDDTDAGYKAATETASEALDIDPASENARVVYGLATAFRGADVRAAARELAAQGEVVQSSQMLASASTELAHARRVLSRRNDSTADLAFAAGLYYAIEDGQVAQARELFIKGMAKSSLASSEPAPTAQAALLAALLARNEGDAAATRTALERALTLEPSWQRPRFELARELAAHNDPNGARRVLSDILTAVPGHSKAKAMLEQVDEVVPAPTGAPTPEHREEAAAPSDTDEPSLAPAPNRAPAVDVHKRLEQLRNEMAPEPEIGTPPEPKAMVHGAPAEAPSAPEAPKAPEAPAPDGEGDAN